MKKPNRLFVLAIIFIGGGSPAWGQTDEHAGHTHPSAVESKPQSSPPAMDHSAHGSSAIPAPSDLRDPHAYSGGYDYSQFPMRHENHHVNSRLVRADRFEIVRADRNTFALYDLQAMYGGSYDWATLKAEGDIDNSELEEASTELLWGHALAAFWNSQLGLRYDSGEGSSQTWLAAGIQGLSPYWFELDATAYLGEQGRTALNVEAEYELLITQKWILQPRLEVDFHGKNDRARAVGAGLSSVAVGLRLRYEIRRELAPYIGAEWTSQFGNSADYTRDANEPTDDVLLVAGLRFWF